MKIYTKSGDKGSTSLYGGQRLSKDNIRIEAYGTVDETNSIIGLIRAAPISHGQDDLLRAVQVELFNIGSHLASDPASDLPLPELNQNLVVKMEHAIDSMSEELPELKSFVLPGGSQASAHAHLGRTVCRRAERRVITLSSEEEVASEIIVFLNRLSDYLFVLARYILQKEGKKDVLWQSGV